MNLTDEQKLAAYLRDRIAAEGGVSSPSYLLHRAQDKFQGLPTCLSDWESLLRSLGFSVGPRLRKDGSRAKSGLAEQILWSPSSTYAEACRWVRAQLERQGVAGAVRLYVLP